MTNDHEQIDSQVIVDLDLFYQKHAEETVDLGLKEFAEGDSRELEESYKRICYCGATNCMLTADTRIYDDYKVDKLRTEEFLNENQHLIRYLEPKSQEHMLSQKDCVVLFPRQISAFVLRSRSWGTSDSRQNAEARVLIETSCS